MGFTKNIFRRNGYYFISNNQIILYMSNFKNIVDIKSKPLLKKKIED